jgi:hypothetical protein
VSADGRYVTYTSISTNLVPGDTNLVPDVFVWDRTTGETTRVSVADDGTQSNGHSYRPAISNDGRYISYYSIASNLVPGDTNNVLDVFVHDRMTGDTSRVSVSSTGTEANAQSFSGGISGDGQYVTYMSSASNLVPGDTNNNWDVFLWDRTTGATSRVSVSSAGTQANGGAATPAISADGRHIVYPSSATNLVPGDTNNVLDVFSTDRTTGETTRVSLASDGTQANMNAAGADVSADGRYVTYMSSASSLVSGDSNNVEDVFVWDRTTGGTTRVSVGSGGADTNGSSGRPAINMDGRYITFFSDASNLVAGDTNNAQDVYLWDRTSGDITRVSVASDGTDPNGYSTTPSVSGNGRYISYHSSASNLVAGDTNNMDDVFVWDRKGKPQV